jgi:hypothetical protein
MKTVDFYCVIDGYRTIILLKYILLSLQSDCSFRPVFHRMTRYISKLNANCLVFVYTPSDPFNVTVIISKTITVFEKIFFYTILSC